MANNKTPIITFFDCNSSFFLIWHASLLTNIFFNVILLLEGKMTPFAFKMIVPNTFP